MINTVEKIYSAITNEFTCYKITYVNSNKEKIVPLDPTNTDYQAIQEWVAEGNTITDNGGN